MIEYGDKMPCHISDGPRDPDDQPLDYVEIDLSDEWRQQAQDDAKTRKKEFDDFVREIFGPKQAN